jgi:hypothetical protein
LQDADEILGAIQEALRFAAAAVSALNGSAAPKGY